MGAQSPPLSHCDADLTCRAEVDYRCRCYAMDRYRRKRSGDRLMDLSLDYWRQAMVPDRALSSSLRCGFPTLCCLTSGHYPPARGGPSGKRTRTNPLREAKHQLNSNSHGLGFAGIGITSPGSVLHNCARPG